MKENRQDSIQNETSSKTEEMPQEKATSTAKTETNMDTDNNDGFSTYFSKFVGAVMGIGVALLGLGLIVTMLYLCKLGYDKWFGEIEGRAIGQNGLMYNYEERAIMKTCPNRVVIAGISELTEINDSTAIISNKYDKYGIINTYTAYIVLPAIYNRIEEIDANSFYALREDTLYTFSLRGFTILKKELASKKYADIRPIILKTDEDYDEYDEYVSRNYADQESILMYEYVDYQGRKGLLNKELKKVTPAKYSHITAIKEDAFFCELYDYEGLGDLLNSKGEPIE